MRMAGGASVQPAGDDRLSRRSREGRFSHQHFIDDTAERVDVGARGDVAVAQRLLGAHVGRRADGDAGGGEPFAGRGIERAGDSEIGHHRFAVGEQDVLRFDVAVDQPVGMGVLECAGHLRRDANRLTHRQLLVALEPGAEGFAFYVGHDVVEGRGSRV